MTRRTSRDELRERLTNGDITLVGALRARPYAAEDLPMAGARVAS